MNVKISATLDAKGCIWGLNAMWYTTGMADTIGIKICVIALTFEGVEKDMCEARVSHAAIYQKIRIQGSDRRLGRRVRDKNGTY